MNVDFITAIKMFFANYATFRGRSTRAEYWWAVLFIFLVSLALSLTGSDSLQGLFNLAVLVPSLAILTRRFHDTGRSGWWVVALYAVELIGLFIFIGVIVSSIIGLATVDSSATVLAEKAVSENIGLACLSFVIMLVPSIVGIVIACLPSAPDNKYGPNPYGEE